MATAKPFFVELFLKFLIYDKKDHVSHTRVWSNVAYALMCIAFTAVTYILMRQSPFPTSEWLTVFIAFGAMVAVNRGYSKYISMLSAKEDNSHQRALKGK